MTQREKCLICLDDVGDISKKHTHLACKCNVSVHTHCWMQYVKTKNGTLECPLCHVITLVNPILPASISGLSKEVHVQENNEDSLPQNSTCVKSCMCGCITWWIGMITIGAIFG
jgi:hypothetical protein